MGKRNTKSKNLAAAMVDSDDTDSMSSSSSMRSDLVPVGVTEEVEKDSLLDQSLDALYEKRGSTREKALQLIVEAFSSELQYEFVENKFATLLQQCLNSIKKGSSRETVLAAYVIGLLALTVGSGSNTHEIVEESVPIISHALRSRADPAKAQALLDCLAIVTFIGGNAHEETEKAMQIMWQVVHPKLGTNVVATKPSVAVITAMVSAWSFLLTTVDAASFNLKEWQEFITYLSTLLDKEDRSVRIAAGEALAVVFETGQFEKVFGPSNSSIDATNGDGNPREGYSHLQGLRTKVLNQMRELAAEAGGKGSAKKDLNSQRNLFRDVLVFLEDGYPPETSMKIGGESLSTSTWSEMIQLNFLRHFLKGGFVKHMQENCFLQDVFGFTPKKKVLVDDEDKSFNRLNEKRLFKSPNSVVSKARTQYLNKQRAIIKDRKAGHYAVGYEG